MMKEMIVNVFSKMLNKNDNLIKGFFGEMKSKKQKIVLLIDPENDLIKYVKNENGVNIEESERPLSELGNFLIDKMKESKFDL